METIKLILQYIDTIILLYFLFAAIYFFVFALASFLYVEKTRSNKTNVPNNVAILVPAYKEDKVIIDTVKSLLDNPGIWDKKIIWVIADSLSHDTISTMKEWAISVLPVKFEKSTKSKSIQKALEYIKPCDYVVVLDADNIPADDFFEKIAVKMNQGFQVVQGHRMAKNNNTAIATLDAISEEVNNSIFRKGHRVLGLSASLIGSGFACEYNLFYELMQQCVAVGGFDKELELLIIQRKVKIGFANDAIVLDEKIQYSEAFVNQRRRWISVQFIYFKNNILNAFKQLLLKGNVDYFDKLIQFFVPPRILSIGISLVMAVAHLLLGIWYLSNGYLIIGWVITAFVSVLAVLIVVPNKYYVAKSVTALLTVPKGFWLTIKALMKIKGANKSFIHTKHGVK